MLTRKLFRWSTRLLVPVLAPFLSPASGAASILCYHRVLPAEEAPCFFRENRALGVSPEDFERHLQFLAANFRPITLDLLVDALAGREKLPEKAVVVTFDDAYDDFRRYAWPRLQQYRIPATLFACDDFLQGRGRLWWYDLEDLLLKATAALAEFSFRGSSRRLALQTPRARVRAFRDLRGLMLRAGPAEQEELLARLRLTTGGASRPVAAHKMLSLQDLQQLANDPLLTVGAHTRSHAVLAALQEDEARAEMTANKRFLEGALNRPVRHLAFPYGLQEFSSREIRLAQECGFVSAVSLNKGHVSMESPYYTLPRLAVQGDAASLADLRTMLSGLEALAWRVRQKCR